MPAVAFANNDIALVAWTFDRHLDGCLGFAVYQRDLDTGKEIPLPALARFASQDVHVPVTTAQAPVQKFWWKDLYARRGGSYQYRIVPLGGKPGALVPLASVAELTSNKVTLTPDRPPFKAFFNRGIVASQAVSHALGDKPSIAALGAHITDPNDDVRKRLMGQIYEGVTFLLDQADSSNGQVHAALYELNDPKGLELRLQAADKGDPKSRNVILGNEQGVDADGKATEDADAENRASLKKAGVPVIDRILGKGDIPHNKFMVLEQGGKAVSVLTGSTNWTSTGLCTQTNNALVVQSPAVAQRYLDYWNALKGDLDQASGNQKKLQGAGLRGWNHANNDSSINSPIKLEDGGGVVEVMFSPNTKATLKSPPKEKPNDMGRLFELVAGAKQAVLFLAFDPGNNSILDAAGTALAKNPDLFVRGALTSTQRAPSFRVALDKAGNVQPGDTSNMHVAVVGEAGSPKPVGKKGKNGKAAKVEPDYRSIPAGNITKNDAFGAWEAELYRYGFAIIHNKVVVIDPFSNNCAVITGSHNLGYRASHNNDENMIIIRGHKPLAQAYACHVLDIYDHYAWRYWLQKFPDQFGKPLAEDDTWQERYILGDQEKSPELRFWMSAATAGTMSPSPVAPKQPATGRPAGQGAASGKSAKPTKSKPTKSRPTKSKPTKSKSKKTKAKPRKTKRPRKAKKSTARKSTRTPAKRKAGARKTSRRR